MKDYDLIVLGSGGAGSRPAKRCAAAGWKVAVINDGPFGGTCSTRGCIPKKVLSGTAEIIDANRRLGDKGIISEQPKLSWSQLIKFKRTFTDSVSPSTQKSLKEAGIDVYSGQPKFSGRLQIDINGETLRAKKVHIAVGAKPAKLNFEGSQHLITSDEFLELDKLPPRIIFVGGGFISFEFAHVSASFGAETTILHGDDRPLPLFDHDIVDTLSKAIKDLGIKLEINSKVTKIEKTGDSFTVTAVSGQTFEADLVVHGAGRPPAIDELNLEATGVEYDVDRGIKVDEYMKTSNPDIYAAGDAADAGPPLSPVAGVQGGIAADNLLSGKSKQPSYHSTPSVVFTSPVVARVGFSENEAKGNGIDFDVISNDISGWFDSKRLGIKHAMSKVLVEKSTKKIIGAHLIGNHAEDLINIFALAVDLGLTTDQLKSPIFVFPTASDDMRSMF